MLGAGGFARVYLANFEDLKRRVAIKILVPTEPPPSLYPSRLNQRFLREAQLISELKNQSTVTMYDFGRSEQGLLYMVFEYVDGKTVEEMINESGAISEARTARIVEQVLHSLDEAHAHGILHRDIKPANIMAYDYLDSKDLVKLLDFGIAKPLMREEDGANLTRDNTLLGTPRYMSPEQIVNESLGPASDLYGLGLVAFEMVMGEPALTETDRSTIIRSHLDAREFQLPHDVPVSPQFRYILEKMVAKRIEDRFSNAKEAIAAIEAWRAGTLQVPQKPHWQEQPTENPDAFPHQGFGGGAAPSFEQTGGMQTGGTQQNFGSTQQGFGVQPGFGGAVPNAFQAPGTGAVPNGAMTKPAKTKIVVEQSPTRIVVTVPPIPSPRDLVFVGLSILVFMIALSFFSVAFLLASGVAAAFFLARLLGESNLVLDLHTGYESSQTVLGLDRSSRGPLSAVLRLEHSVDDDDNASLTLATHDGDRKFARNLTVDEAKWVEATVNGFLEASRGKVP